MEQTVAGQRWVSDSEPELGLGVMLKVEFGRVEIFFPAAGEHRQYAQKSAPLRRVRFDVGDRVKTHEGDERTVEAVETQGGLLVYQTDKGPLPEAELSDTISFSKPQDRLLGSQVDDTRTFDLRLEALEQRSRLRKSPVRGFVGGRVDLIPHQMTIAAEVSGRLLPRVLLADEVGLGKTIEACLILHRLHLTGRASRVLILVPEPLVHQWFVELLRRFNLMFSLFDEERCMAIEENEGMVNPFHDSQLVLAPISLFVDDELRMQQVMAADWDLLIVDEAHHLAWSIDDPSAEYELVEALAEKTDGLLLLTATPQQLGPEGHFARLRLLDPNRYTDLGAFLEEADHYEEVAGAVDRVMKGKALTAKDKKLFASKSERVKKHSEELAAGNEDARRQLVSDLLDEFGTGRVMFRNTRAVLTGFPKREASLVKVKPVRDGDDIDAKVKWLAGLLKELGEAKVLTICRTAELAMDVGKRLQREINLNWALFHEDMTLMQRDRNAAHFSNEDGARVLICSEIGSEGRNFQFAQHLVLFDLPDDPELLEQRIGRLDRIGQTATIHIHVPYLAGTGSEVLARWYHEGLGAFETNLHGATEIWKRCREGLAALATKFDAKKLKAFIEESKKARAEVTEKLARGHDRLLEWNSRRPSRAAAVLKDMAAKDADYDFEQFFIHVLDFFGLHVEEHGNRCYFLQQGHMLTEAFPALPEEGMLVTFDRQRALSREDIGFLTIDHPLVRGAMDLLLGSEHGNSSFAVWKGSGGDALMLECCFVVETVAPAALHVDRFLPVTPVRVVMNHSMKDKTAASDFSEVEFFKGNIGKLLEQTVVKHKLVPGMLKKAESLATKSMKGVVAEAAKTMAVQLDEEIERLEDLGRINDHVRPEEIAALRAQKDALQEALNEAQLRLDAVRLIWCRP